MPEKPGVQDLLGYLAAIDAAHELPDVPTQGDEEEPCLQSEDHPAVAAVIRAADDVLITAAGCCNWPAIEQVRAAGYPVFAGEVDRFGWLTGCIATRKGIVVYG